ncbi:MAG TPA: hypothetical protein VEZ20_11925 [Allosphingosinicella sp.]|jgi:hypothetical protein|nr:hypothetical protein [Allosphingosinicella sp.]
MRLSTRFGLTGIGALGLLAAVHRLRTMERPPHPTRDYLIGVLPNFAAAIAITFVLLSIWSDQNKEAGFAAAKRPFLLCAFTSGFGLLAWELFQKTSSRLVFDPHDVAATFLGIGAATILFHILRAQSPSEV